LAWICGDVAVWKPSEKTPLCSIACQKIIGTILKENNLPEGISCLLNGGAEVGQWLSEDRRVPLLSATGSTAMGKKVAHARGSRCSNQLSHRIGCSHVNA
jgi:aldehyde dehydrogenase (NAD+)